jgi:sugar fermentation stimulation protein A
MRFPSKPLEATFIKRLNRFLGLVEIEGAETECFIPNPGRMKELLEVGKKVYLLGIDKPYRKTSYDLVLVSHNGKMVSIDSRVPNKVFQQAIEFSMIPELDGYSVRSKEYTFLNSRLDFLLEGKSKKPLLLEVKSCTLAKGDVAIFPDAPTKRSVRHISDLVQAFPKKRAAIFFLIQRDDACIFKPNNVTDPVFTEALRKASILGLEIYAYNSLVTLDYVQINEKMTVKL